MLDPKLETYEWRFSDECWSEKLSNTTPQEDLQLKETLLRDAERLLTRLCRLTNLEVFHEHWGRYSVPLKKTISCLALDDTLHSIHDDDDVGVLDYITDSVEELYESKQDMYDFYRH